MDPFSRLFIFSPMKDNKKVHKCIHQKHFRVGSIKISNVVTKETSRILLQTLQQSINQSKILFNFEFVDSKIANISEENKSIK